MVTTRVLAVKADTQSKLYLTPTNKSITSPQNTKDAKTTTFEKTRKSEIDDEFGESLGISATGRGESTRHLNEGLQKNAPLLEFILKKVKDELEKPESDMYMNSKGKFKQVYELIGDNRDLRELLKKLNFHIDHHYEKARLKELHEENKRSQTKVIPHKQVSEESKVLMRMKINQK